MSRTPYAHRRIPYAPENRRAPTIPSIARLLVVAAAVLCAVMLWTLFRAASSPASTYPEGAEWNLVLVNEDHALPRNFTVDTVEMPGGERVDARIADSLNALLQGARDAGYHPFIRSGYRTREQQEQILNERIERSVEEGTFILLARQEALRWVAEPGTSEHELGLAVDINDEHGDDGLYDWLNENAPAYGFIQRYPSGKTSITGISHEPWHYRYVGQQAAQKMQANNQCLEEYLS